MNRRKFLRASALLSAPLLLKGVPVFAGNNLTHPWLQNFAKTANYCNKVLVIIQLNGGNDGLNMVIPLDKYSELSAARSGLMIPQAAVLPLSGTITTGLHPAMSGLRDLYNSGKMAIVQGVSYPNPNYSHFQAQDIWFSSPATSAAPLDTGWLGRDLDASYPGFPTGYPNAASPDPLAIQIGGALPLSIQGQNINMGYNVPNPAALISVANAAPAPAPASDYGTELTFLRMMKDQSNAYSSRISVAYNAQQTQSTMYAASGNSLSDQLRVVARLIGGGLTTQVYIVNHPDSFDTHVSQVAGASNTTTGTHANSLSKLSVAVSAFMNDLALMGKDQQVTGMTFSEFGRRVVSNASAGTDHGTAAPVLFFGAALSGGILGSSPNIPAVSTTNTQVNTQYDFRQLYATVLQKWMCMSAVQSQGILNTSASTNQALNLFNTAPLPMEGIDISAAWDGDRARVDFLAHGNEGYGQFAVERSFNARDFTPGGQVPYLPGAGAQAYRYTEPRLNAPEVYYRVLGVSRQGEVRYSAVAKLAGGARAQSVRIYPNPVVNHTIHIELLQAVTELVEVEIYDLRGSRLYYNGMQPQGGRLSFRIPDMVDSYTPYILRVRWGSEDVREQISFA